MVKNFTNMKKQGTTTSHLRSLNIKNTRIYGVGNLSPGMGRALKYAGVIPDNGIPALRLKYDGVIPVNGSPTLPS
jgi:hypothetical protein